MLQKEIKDLLFSAKTEEDLKDAKKQVFNEYVQALADEKQAELINEIKSYLNWLLPKKEEFWQKYPNARHRKKGFTAAPKMLFSTETDKAIGELAKAMTEYYKEQLKSVKFWAK